MLKEDIIKRQFLKSDFLLETETAQQLYDLYAAPMPIIDYHNHLSPKDIAEDKNFGNLSEIWLTGDHYKWRAMRINGIGEHYITGNASPEEKFMKWAETVPCTMRNPLFHWTHLELKNYFGIDAMLNKSTAQEIYKACNTLLATPEFSSLGLLRKMNVEIVCTTDDPADSLEHHIAFAKKSSDAIKMFPTFRPDKAFAVEDAHQYRNYLEVLGNAAGMSILNFDDLMEALAKRIDFF